MVEHDRALILRTQLYVHLRDHPEEFLWMTGTQRTDALERLWPGGVLPERGSDGWRRLRRHAVDTAQEFNVLIAAVAAQTFRRRIAIRVILPRNRGVVQVVAPFAVPVEGAPIGLELQMGEAGPHFVVRDIDNPEQLPDDKEGYTIL